MRAESVRTSNGTRRLPTSRIFTMGEGWTFECVSRTVNRKPSIFYRYQFSPQTGLHRGHQCEYCVRSDAPAFGELKNGRHPHKSSIRAFAEEPFIPQYQMPLAEEFARFVCFANISLNQATQSSTKHFCDALTRNGFQLGRARLRMQRSPMRICSRSCLSAGFVKQLPMVMRRDCVPA
jgi:hypothetical protein